jgi:hypothetical protein
VHEGAGQIPELATLEFLRGCQRQPVAKCDVAGRLEISEPLKTEVQDVPSQLHSSGIILLRAKHYACHHLVPAYRIRHGGHAHASYLGMLKQHTLDLHGGYILAAAPDDVLLTVNKVEIAIFIGLNDITRMKVSAFPGLGAGLGILQITAEESEARCALCPPDQQLPRLACCSVIALVIDDAVFDT